MSSVVGGDSFISAAGRAGRELAASERATPRATPQLLRRDGPALASPTTGPASGGVASTGSGIGQGL